MARTDRFRLTLPHLSPSNETEDYQNWDALDRTYNGAPMGVGVLDRQSLNAAAGSIVFRPPPSNYTHLEFWICVQSDQAADIGFGMYLNSDTNVNNYFRQTVSGSGAAASASSGASASIGIAPVSANRRSGLKATLFDYLSNFHKIVCATGMDAGSATFATLQGYVWTNTAAVNRISIQPDVGNFTTNSYAVMYGVIS